VSVRYLTMKGTYGGRVVTCAGVMPPGTAGGRFVEPIEGSNTSTPFLPAKR
jgi:hypothetical protein